VSTALVGFPGLDYSEHCVLLERGEPLSAEKLVAITRIVLRLDSGIAVDSGQEPDAFAWPIDTEWQKRPAKGVRIRLGDAAIPPGKYVGTLVIFDPDHPRGVPWDTVTVGIKDFVP